MHACHAHVKYFSPGVAIPRSQCHAHNYAEQCIVTDVHNTVDMARFKAEKPKMLVLRTSSHGSQVLKYNDNELYKFTIMHHIDLL